MPIEPITAPRTTYTVTLDEDEDIHEFTEKQLACFWTHHEVDLDQDVVQWREVLTDDERTFLTHVLAFFAGSDGIIMENLHRFESEVTVPNMNVYYSVQNGVEGVHSIMYAKLLEAFMQDRDALRHAREAIHTVPSIQRKANWALRWMGDLQRPFAERLLVQACSEGIHFSSSFCAIFWLKKRNMMPGLTLSNEWISRDEGIHRDFACHVFKTRIVNKPSVERCHEIVREAVDAECAFVDDALHVEFIGMNANQMKTYVKVISNHLLISCGLPPLYTGIINPFKWMSAFSMARKSNFFENRPSDYAMAGSTEGMFAQFNE
jgi:ribonucleoside-diphosphate reductase subunit M2